MTSTSTIGQLQQMSATQLNALGASNLRGLGAAQVQALSATQLNGMSASAFGALDAAYLTGAQVGSLTSALVNLTLDQASQLSTTQVTGLSAAQLSQINGKVISALGQPEVAALSKQQIQGISASAISQLSTATLNQMSAGQVQALTRTQVQALTGSQIAGLGATAIGALDPSSLTNAQLASLTASQVSKVAVTSFASGLASRLSYLSAPALAGVTAAQVQTMTAAVVAGTSASVLNALSPTALGALSKAQIQALSVAQVSGLSGSALNAVDLSALTAPQRGALSATQIALVSVANFQKSLAPNLSSLGTAALAGLTQAQSATLTQAQLASLSPTQILTLATSSLTGTAKAFASDFGSVMATAQKVDVGNTMTFASAQSLLTSSAQGGMTSGKLAALQAVAAEINAASGPSVKTSAMVQQLFDKVTLVTSENAYWTGGGSASAALGNLTATSSQTQVSQLIGKWFLGTDDPSLTGTYATGYTAQSTPLFSAAGPRASDVNQGTVGDCYFLAGLASEASQTPNAIKNMITSVGNGIYVVDFKRNGADDYITVDSAMATLPRGYAMGDGSNLAFDNGGSSGSAWTQIVEKAYAEFRGDTDPSSNSASAPQNSYVHISGGWDAGIAAVTGRSITDAFCTAGAAPPASLAGNLQSAIAAKDVVTMSTGATASGLVANHMYAVLGINAASGSVTLDNPWNANGPGGNGVQTMSLAALAAQGVVFHLADGPSLFA